MAKYYSLVPLPEGIFKDVPLIDRVVFGLIWERYRLSGYKVTGGDETWVDADGEIFCVYSHDELARLTGTSEKTIRRALIDLRDKHFMIDWCKAAFKGSCRYYIEPAVKEHMAALRQNNKTVSDCP